MSSRQKMQDKLLSQAMKVIGNIQENTSGMKSAATKNVEKLVKQWDQNKSKLPKSVVCKVDRVLNFTGLVQVKKEAPVQKKRRAAPKKRKPVVAATPASEQQ